MAHSITTLVCAMSLLLLLTTATGKGEYRHVLDDNGYIVYCPCMGRFGNQADQFIGALRFAKGMNRTLILPPWVTYPPNKPFTSLQIPFDRWFKVEPLLIYHRVITMEQFMHKFSPRVWPAGMRTGFCYSFRDGKSCAMKEGNPFGPFWDNFGIDFNYYVEHKGLFWNTWDEDVVDEWKDRFPNKKYPVLAFHGAPGSFPSLERNQYLQKYIHFSDYISEKADNFIKKVIGGRKYVGIHLRNGIDMTRVCRDIEADKYESLFSSAQCTGYDKSRPLTVEMCDPPRNEIMKKVRAYITKLNATALFIATDNDPLIQYFQGVLKKDIKITQWKAENTADDPIVDLALLSKADFFIGNCVSSFSAFVRRHRVTRNEDFTFFSDGQTDLNDHDEL